MSVFRSCVVTENPQPELGSAIVGVSTMCAMQIACRFPSSVVPCDVSGTAEPGGDRRRAFHRSLPMKRMGDESSAEACRREVAEELGIDVEVGEMMCADYNRATTDYVESLMFVFRVPTLTSEQTDSIRLRTARCLNSGSAHSIRRASCSPNASRDVSRLRWTPTRAVATSITNSRFVERCRPRARTVFTCEWCWPGW